ncbi:MAG: hypothetical protein ABDI07_12310, partial [Candidatus Kryptonium sp.]
PSQVRFKPGSTTMWRNLLKVSIPHRYDSNSRAVYLIWLYLKCFNPSQVRFKPAHFISVSNQDFSFNPSQVRFKLW